MKSISQPKIILCIIAVIGIIGLIQMQIIIGIFSEIQKNQPFESNLSHTAGIKTQVAHQNNVIDVNIVAVGGRPTYNGLPIGPDFYIYQNSWSGVQQVWELPVYLDHK